MSLRGYHPGHLLVKKIICAPNMISDVWIGGRFVKSGYLEKALHRRKLDIAKETPKFVSIKIVIQIIVSNKYLRVDFGLFITASCVNDHGNCL